MLDSGALQASLQHAKGYVPAARAMGVPDARYICIVADSARTSDAVAELRATYSARAPDSATPEWEGHFLYAVTPGGEKFLSLTDPGIDVEIEPYGLYCVEGDAVFYREGGAWALEPPPEPNRGSPEGNRIVKALAARSGDIDAAALLKIEGLRYVCIAGSRNPSEHLEMIEFLFKEKLPKSKLPMPAMKRLEAGIYVVSEMDERYIVFPEREGLSADGEYCVEAEQGVFRKRRGKWMLDRRDNIDLDRRLAAEATAGR